jgi:hypothetical protein
MASFAAKRSWPSWEVENPTKGEKTLAIGVAQFGPVMYPWNLIDLRLHAFKSFLSEHCNACFLQQVFGEIG